MTTMSLRVRLGFAIFAGFGLFSGSVLATPITVNNFSFETPSSNNGGTACPITGWTCSVNTAFMGVYAPVNQQYPAGANGLAGGLIVPDGSQAAYFSASGENMTQSTAALVAA